MLFRAATYAAARFIRRHYLHAAYAAFFVVDHYSFTPPLSPVVAHDVLP
jgi:hypothetical protein